MNRPAPRRSALALLLLVTWAGSAPSAAQTPVAVATGSGGEPRARPTAGPAVAAVSPGGRAPAQDLPSTVSPAIERFMKEAGRNLPSPPPLPAAVVAQGRGPVPTPGVPSVVTPLEGTALDRTSPAAPSATPLEGTALDRASPAAPSATPGRPAGDTGLASTGPSPLTVGLTLKPAPLEPTDVRLPINLATALRLADARPLIVAAAQAGVWVAEADLTRAKVLWVPTALYGADYIRHDGGGPDFNKGIMTAPSVNYLMAGGGATIYINLTDSYYEPLVARRVLNAAHWDTQAAKNDAVLQTADAYFRVHQYRGMYSGSLYAVQEARVLVEKIAELSREFVPKVEVDRARNMLADMEQQAVSARQEWRVSSANLTQVLRLDPRAVVVPLEHDHTQVTLVDPGRSLDDLMPVALTNRPELASRRAQVQAAEVRVRREKARPFVPIVMINGFQHAGMLLQAGVFGIGPNSSLNQYRGRDDVSVQLMWQAEGLGFGNLARIKAQRGNESRAIVDFRNAQDAVAADVNRALANVQSGAARIVQADPALRTSIVTFNGHLEGLEQTRRLGNVLVLTFRPQEAVYSLQQLNVSFNEYFTTVADYNRAQFELFHALGYPASEVARLRPVGLPQPVTTGRPPYLPRVGNGPPPSTR